MTSKVWDVMNDLEMVTSKIVSAREIIDTAVEAIQKHDHDKAETLAMAAYEFLGYYLDEFDEKFKLAWQETVCRGDADKIVFRTNGEDKTPNWNNCEGSTVSSINRAPEKKNGVTYSEYLNAAINANSHWNDGWTREHYQKIVDKYEGKKETLSCDKDDPSAECQKSWNEFWEPSEDSSEVEETIKQEGYDWTPIPPKGDKVVKWRLPVEVDGPSGEYFVMFPDDLLEAANLEEGDKVEWVDRGDGSYLLRKVESNA